MIKVVENLNKLDALYNRFETGIQTLKDNIDTINSVTSDAEVEQIKKNAEPYSDLWQACINILERGLYVSNLSFEEAVAQAINQLESTLQSTEQNYQEVKDLNDRLRKCKTVYDLEELEDYMNSFGKGYWYNVKTKTGGYVNNKFKNALDSNWAKDEYTVVYITDRDSRYRECKVSNLWKSIYIC